MCRIDKPNLKHYNVVKTKGAKYKSTHGIKRKKERKMNEDIISQAYKCTSGITDIGQGMMICAVQ